MKFWLIANTQEEGVFYDFEKKADVTDLSETCFLPTEEMANQFIEDELSVRYKATHVTVDVIEEQGSWSYTRQKVGEWGE